STEKGPTRVMWVSGSNARARRTLRCTVAVARETKASWVFWFGYWPRPQVRTTSFEATSWTLNQYRSRQLGSLEPTTLWGNGTWWVKYSSGGVRNAPDGPLIARPTFPVASP